MTDKPQQSPQYATPTDADIVAVVRKLAGNNPIARISVRFMREGKEVEFVAELKEGATWERWTQ